MKTTKVEEEKPKVKGGPSSRGMRIRRRTMAHGQKAGAFHRRWALAPSLVSPEPHQQHAPAKGALGSSSPLEKDSEEDWRGHATPAPGAPGAISE